MKPTWKRNPRRAVAWHDSTKTKDDSDYLAVRCRLRKTEERLKENVILSPYVNGEQTGYHITMNQMKLLYRTPFL